MGALKIVQTQQTTRSDREVPSFLEFSPQAILWQHRANYDVLHAPYMVANDHGINELETHEFLFSGSVGSAKSMLLCHIIVNHCITYRKAKVGIGRESMKDLKDTLYQMILDHLDGSFEEGKDYKINGKGHIIFRNKSKIIPFSWHDKRYKKFRSHTFSLFVIEELTENKTRDFYDEIKMRMGRMTTIPFSAIICATNPDDPAHWAYDYFIKGKETNPRIHVYYSITTHNTFLNPSYIRGLQATLDPKMALRMLKGQWISIVTDKIYYSYDDEKNVLRAVKDIHGKVVHAAYDIDPRLPVGMTWDFNIGVGKPMSMCLFQIVKRNGTEQFIFFDEIIIEGSRTRDVLEELASKGYLDKGYRFKVYGDATMKSGHSSSIKTDYEIIKEFLANYETPLNEDGKTRDPVIFEMKVALANPPIRTRHNKVNALLCNDLKERNLLVTENCTTIRKGLQLTALKKGADYIEDDSKPYQHVTTAIGYAICKHQKGDGTFKTTVTHY